VTLTVTDAAGATTSLTQPITVGANQAPVAAFTSSAQFLVASFDGSGSSDAEGPVASYAWDFGDGSTGTGVTASHTYAAGGSYSVTLTVTDAAGATTSLTQPVTVAAQQVAALDTMSRTSSSGWGTADVGGAWTTSSPASNFTVANGRASMVIATLGGGAAGYLNSVSALNVDVTADVAYDKPATGGGFYTSLISRRIGTSDYRVKVRAMPTSTQLYLAKTVNGVETVIASGNVTGVFQPGNVLHVRFQVTGSGTATLTAKAWFDGTAEPAAAMLTATDTTATLQAAGAVGIYGYLSGSATNAPYATLIDNFRVGIS
jgi:PKD repeat protein